jgi:hypothetical protein
MAMQRSDELPETSLLLFQQFRQLGETADQLSIGIVHEEKEWWRCQQQFRVSQLDKIYKVDIDEPFVMKKAYDGWKTAKKIIDNRPDRTRIAGL